MNIPYTVLRTEMFGEEDWSIAVKKEHAPRVPNGFKLQEYKPGNGEINAYETKYPYTDIRYFVPDRDRLDEILSDIGTGALRHKFQCVLGDVYEGAISLRDELLDEQLKSIELEREKVRHKVNMHNMNHRAKTKYRQLHAVKLMEEYSVADIAQMLGISQETVKNYTRIVGEETREEKMIKANKRKRLARSLYTRGQTLYDIAEYLGISVELTKQYIGSYYDQNKEGDTKYAEVIRMKKEGRTQQAIARELNIDRVTVYYYIRRYGEPVEFEVTEFDPAFKKEVMKLSQQGKTIKHIADKFECIYDKVRYYLKYDEAGHPVPKSASLEDVMSLKNQGKDVKEIADTLCLSQARIYEILKQ